MIICGASIVSKLVSYDPVENRELIQNRSVER